MMQGEIYRDKQGNILRFRILGHAGYGEAGSDIVCAAATMLILNTANSIELFTETPFTVEADEKAGGFFDCIVQKETWDTTFHDSQLLLKAMEHGLLDMEQEYGAYIKIVQKEVAEC